MSCRESTYIKARTINEERINDASRIKLRGKLSEPAEVSELSTHIGTRLSSWHSRCTESSTLSIRGASDQACRLLAGLSMCVCAAWCARVISHVPVSDVAWCKA